MAIERTKAFRALKHLGKVATQLEFSFYVDRVENVPVGVDYIFSVQRGERLCSTSECRSVQLEYRSNGVVAFRELLVLPVTLYMEKTGGEFLQKYAKCFLRRVGKIGNEPKTQGKIHLDLSKLVRFSPADEDTVFQLSDGSRLFMTISWKSSKSNFTSYTKPGISEGFGKMENLLGNRDWKMESEKAPSDSKEVIDAHTHRTNVEESREVGKKYSLDYKVSRRPRKLKVFESLMERNKSLDESKAVREDVLSKLMEENALLRKHLVETRSEMEHHYFIETTQNAEISKLRAELEGFRRTFQNDENNNLGSSKEMERVVVTNQELLIQFGKLEEHYKSQIRSLFCEVYRLRELVNSPDLSRDSIAKFSEEHDVSNNLSERNKGIPGNVLGEAFSESNDTDHKLTRIYHLQRQLLLQREESANLLSELIRTKVSLALALESMEWLSFQNRKNSRQNKTEVYVPPLWTKFLPWKLG